MPAKLKQKANRSANRSWNNQQNQQVGQSPQHPSRKKSPSSTSSTSTSPTFSSPTTKNKDKEILKTPTSPITQDSYTPPSPDSNPPLVVPKQPKQAMSSPPADLFASPGSTPHEVTPSSQELNLPKPPAGAAAAAALLMPPPPPPSPHAKTPEQPTPQTTSNTTVNNPPPILSSAIPTEPPVATSETTITTTLLNPQTPPSPSEPTQPTPPSNNTASTPPQEPLTTVPLTEPPKISLEDLEQENTEDNDPSLGWHPNNTRLMNSGDLKQAARTALTYGENIVGPPALLNSVFTIAPALGIEGLLTTGLTKLAYILPWKISLAPLGVAMSCLAPLSTSIFVISIGVGLVYTGYHAYLIWQKTFTTKPSQKSSTGAQPEDLTSNPGKVLSTWLLRGAYCSSLSSSFLLTYLYLVETTPLYATLQTAALATSGVGLGLFALAGLIGGGLALARWLKQITPTPTEAAEQNQYLLQNKQLLNKQPGQNPSLSN